MNPQKSSTLFWVIVSIAVTIGIIGLGCATIFTFIFLIPDHRPTIHDVSGTYRGAYAHIEETIDLMPDGSLHQIAKKKSSIIYDNWGSWKIENSDVYFYNFIVAVDQSEGELIKRKELLPFSPTKYGVVQVGDEGGTPKILCSAPDTLYYWEKIKKTEPIQAPQTTIMADTPAAAHPSRQP